ncbi:MAG TPA: nuclear transport factor 2 family protein [Chthoniobacter sp.]|nr:nuclear transport factor 2 family protein [Chthoniobacter sp.]
MNANDGPAFETLFAPDAVVEDEDQEYRGVTAIGGWLAEVHRKYRPTFEATEVSESDGEIVIGGTVSGTFKGSPIDIFHHLTIADRRIAALTIRG